jgi:UAA transporter family
MSETIMHQFGVGQDEFIFRMYSIALIAISAAAGVKGDLWEGMVFLSQPGTYAELDLPLSERTWSISAKWTVLFLFSTMGFFGSSCSAAITKNFGALTMSITSTARKALSLFLSFMIFNNECTLEHVGGIFLFLTALIFKSYKTSKAPNKRPVRPPSSRGSELSLEMGSLEPLPQTTMGSPGNAKHRTPSSPKPVPGSYGIV